MFFKKKQNGDVGTILCRRFLLFYFYILVCSFVSPIAVSRKGIAFAWASGEPSGSDFNEAMYLAYSSSVIFGTLLFFVFDVLLIQNPPRGNL